MRELLYVSPGRTMATGVMGMLVPELANPVFPVLAQAIERCATERGYASILCNTEGEVDHEIAYVHMLLDRDVDGMIFISCEMTNLEGDHDHYARLIEDGARLVFVNGALSAFDVPSVRVDEEAAGEIATHHLLSLGHLRIGFVAGPSHYLPTQEKSRGRSRALRSVGVDPNGLVAHGEFSFSGGRAALRQLLERADPPTGVICSSDVMAFGVMQEAAAAGLRVPEDLSVVGFDGIEAIGWTRPPLTTVEQPIDQIAETAVGALTALIDAPERPLPNFVFRPKLRPGSSTAPPGRA